MTRIMDFSLLHSLSTVTNIPIALAKEKNFVAEFPMHLKRNPLFNSLEEHIHTFNILKEKIDLVSTDLFEYFLSIPINKINQEKCWLVLGPVIYQQPTRSTLYDVLHAFSLDVKIDEIEKYLLSLPFVHMNQLIEAGNLAFYLLTGIPLNIIKEMNTLKLEYYANVTQSQTNYIYKIRANSTFHHDPILERRIYQLVEDGNVDEVIPYYKAFMDRGDFELGVLSKVSELRSQKNTTIATITLATRAAIRGDVHPEDAYATGDIMIQELEEFNTVEKVIWFREQILYEFANMVNITKNRKYSRRITLTQEVIYKHIYDLDLGLDFIAEKVGLHNKYLSNLFRKEVGVTISEFINKLKIKEAKKLLIYFNRPISEVSNTLNFTDQSHFTKVFKKYTQLTPKQFIEQYKFHSFF